MGAGEGPPSVLVALGVVFHSSILPLSVIPKQGLLILMQNVSLVLLALTENNYIPQEFSPDLKKSTALAVWVYFDLGDT